MKNPSAFPVPDGASYGMDLRDYFAAKAMQAIINKGLMSSFPNDTAEDAYRFADALLKARSK